MLDNDKMWIKCNPMLMHFDRYRYIASGILVYSKQPSNRKNLLKSMNLSKYES